ncbi:ABC-2 type transport system permease protein [Pullulanibacillus pueri]|uniref:Transport permease protein n=1 Tax=Pullulanibacillus pueri TaxID=1437324 RepID=A0A8J2ZTF6_9BACL|nr:ABC transporter permease [Pullulanibacillus pueri]MBM7681098.1 ABC-2 type transport system permease protein [Pullulanibacillus pueri]GGH77037.1 transport permease protein [Pullulanibacillus pueri]
MRSKAIASRIIRQFIRDKRTLALMLIAPLFILTLVSLVFNGKDYHPTIAFVHVPKKIIQTLDTKDTHIKTMEQKRAQTAIHNGDIDAIVSNDQGTLKVLLEGSDPSTNQAILQWLQKQQLKGQPGKNLSVHYLHGGKDLNSFDNFGSVLLGFFVFFFVFIVSGVSFLRERTTGTLERLLSTPIRRGEIVCGYIFGFGLFTLIQSTLVTWYSINVLNMWMVGSFWLVLLIIVLLALTALTLGTLLSAFANNELQMIQFIPLVIVPQVFFSGLFKIDTISDWISWIAPFMPLYYGADALRNIMLRGNGFADITLDILALCGFILLFVVLNILVLRRYRKL